MSNKSIPKKNKITSTPRKISSPQTQTGNDYNSEQRLERGVGESNAAYHQRQKTESQKKEQNAKKPQEDGLIQRGKNYANSRIDRTKEYGTQKGKKAINKGVNYAKEKLAENPKMAGAISKAQEAKQRFEERMNAFRDNAELSAQKPPIKQRVGESDGDFRKRQKLEDEETPESPKRMGLGGAAKQYAKKAANKQLRKGTDFARRKGSDYLAKNPKTAAALKEAKEKAEAFKKRRSEDIKKLAEKKKALAAKINALKNKLNIKKRAEDKAKQLAAQLAKKTVMFILRIVIATIGTFSEFILIGFGIAIIAVVIIAAIYYTCEQNIITESFCSAFGITK